MEMIAVESSNLAQVGYNEEKRLLRVEFHDGAIWEYERIPPGIHSALMAAQSKNTYFRAHIRGTFPATKLR